MVDRPADAQLHRMPTVKPRGAPPPYSVDAIVYVVDDDAAIRESIGSLLGSVGLRAKAFASAQEFLGCERPDVPACLILDVRLPGASGLDLQPELAKGEAPIPVIFLTGHGTIPMSVRAMKTGAAEFLTKPFDGDVLIAAVREALARDRLAREGRAEVRQLRARYDRLTPRERQVLGLVVQGRLNKLIAAQLGMAEQTVKVHRSRVMHKLEVDSVAALVRAAERIAGQPSS